MKRILVLLTCLLLATVADAGKSRLYLLDDYSGPSYDFRDDFSDTLAAGSVHNTLSTSGHVRTVIDTYASVELVTNGGFDSATTGWLNDNATLASVAGGQDGNCLEITRTGGSIQDVYRSVTTIVGKTYTFSAYVKSGTSGNEAFRLKAQTPGGVDVGTIGGTTSGTWTQYSVVITPTTTTTYIVFFKDSATDGTMLLDTVSVLPTSGLLSITNGALTFAGGKASPGWGDPGYWGPSTARAAGKMIVTNHIYATIANAPNHNMGYDTNQSGAIPDTGDNVKMGGVGGTFTNGLYTILSGGTSGTYYSVSAQRTTGSFVFMKGGPLSSFRLMSVANVENAATIYPTISNYNSAFTSSFIRVPSLRFLPTPLLSHGFATVTTPSAGDGHAETTGLGSGGSGVVMTGATWAVSGAKAVNSPTGTELLDGWTNSGGAYAYETFTTSGSSITSAINTVSTMGLAYKDLGAQADEKWFYYTHNVLTNTGSAVYSGQCNTIYFDDCKGATANSGTGVYSTSYRTSTTARQYLQLFANNTAANFSTDSESLKELSLPTLFLTAPLSTAHVLNGVKITKTSTNNTDGIQAGVVCNLDSAASPANFIIAYLDGAGNMKVDKNVAGTYTNIISAAVTYSAGATLLLITDAGAIRAYYNNTLVGTATVADAGVINNLTHGLFSTSSGSAFDDWTVYSRGNSGEYSLLNQFIN